MLFKNIVVTHDSNHHAIPVIRFYLERLFGGHVPANIYLIDNIPEALQTITSSAMMPSLIICSGKTTCHNKEMMAGRFAQVVKDIAPQAVVVTCTNSLIHKDEPGSLDGFISRHVSDEQFAELVRNFLGAKGSPANLSDHLHDYRIAEFIAEALEIKAPNEFKGLFAHEKDKVFGPAWN